MITGEAKTAHQVIAKDFAAFTDDELFTIVATNLAVLIRLRDMGFLRKLRDGEVWRQALADIARARQELDRRVAAMKKIKKRRAAMTGRDPQTPEQWQEAVDSAEFFLALDSARQYGLIVTDIKVDVDRCHDLLTRGIALGYTHAPLHALIAKYLGSPASVVSGGMR